MSTWRADKSSGTPLPPSDNDNASDGADASQGEGRQYLSLAEEGLRRGLRVRFRALGSLMAPTVTDGEWLIVEPIAPVSVREGDVVLALVEHGLAARRVIAVREKIALDGQEFAADFALKGDARGSAIGVVGGHRIVGRVVAVDRDGLPISLEPAPLPPARKSTTLTVPLLLAAVAAAAAALLGSLPLLLRNR